MGWKRLAGFCIYTIIRVSGNKFTGSVSRISFEIMNKVRLIKVPVIVCVFRGITGIPMAKITKDPLKAHQFDQLLGRFAKIF